VATVHQWWGDVDPLGNNTLLEGKCGAPVHFAAMLMNFVNKSTFSDRRGAEKNVVGGVIEALHPVVAIKKCINMTQAALDCIRMGATTLINEIDRVIHSFRCAAASFYVPVCLPAVTDDCSPGTPAVLYFVSPILLATYERAVFDFDSLVGTDNFLSSAPHVVQHDLSREFGPNSDGCRTELMLLLDRVMRIAMNDVVREE